MIHVASRVQKMRSASREAQNRLSIAQQLLHEGNSRGFYDEVSKAYLGYACDKTGMPLSQLTKETLHEKLSTLQISKVNIEDFVKIVQTCEVALFAGLDNASSMMSTYQQAINIINAIEAELSKTAS